MYESSFHENNAGLFICLLSPSKASEDDTSQFDSKFTKQTPVDSPDDTMLSESVNQVFKVSNIHSQILMTGYV